MVRILLAEDDAATRDLVQRALGLDGHEVVVTQDGSEALEYLRATQMTALAHVTRVERHDPGTTVLLDRATRRRLDLVERTDGERAGTLLEVLDRTKTAMGGRALREWVLSPLRDPSAIRRRHEGVEELVKDAALRRDVVGALSGGGAGCYIPSPMECTSYQQCVCQRPDGIYNYGQCIGGYCQF